MVFFTLILFKSRITLIIIRLLFRSLYQSLFHMHIMISCIISLQILNFNLFLLLFHLFDMDQFALSADQIRMI